jgi:hypothetical protein
MQTIPFYLPIRSKYMQIELLKFLFKYKAEVAVFLRTISKKGQQFYTRYQGELDMLFEVMHITLEPPLKFQNTGIKASETIDLMQARLL